MTLVVILDNVLDAHKSLLARLDVPHEVVEVAVSLAPAVADLVIVVAVRGNQVDDNLVGDHVLPVCSGRDAVVEHCLGRVEVCPRPFQQVTDLGQSANAGMHIEGAFARVPNGF